MSISWKWNGDERYFSENGNFVGGGQGVGNRDERIPSKYVQSDFMTCTDTDSNKGT